jgi:hypothetical protein
MQVRNQARKDRANGVPPAKHGEDEQTRNPVFELGYLTLTVSMAGAGNPTLTSTFRSTAARPTRDGFVLDLKTGEVKTK